MRKSKIDIALETLNAKRGLTSSDIGFLYYADIRGDGVRRPRTVWRVINTKGGVARSNINSRSPAKTLEKIRAIIHGLPLFECGDRSLFGSFEGARDHAESVYKKTGNVIYISDVRTY